MNLLQLFLGFYSFNAPRKFTTMENENPLVAYYLKGGNIKRGKIPLMPTSYLLLEEWQPLSVAKSLQDL
jgi:hypothetical protein